MLNGKLIILPKCKSVYIWRTHLIHTPGGGGSGSGTVARAPD